MRVDILQVEYELREVFDAVDVVVGWGRDERDTGDAVACLGYHLVHLESRKLSALSGLGTLCHFDLYFFGIDEIFRSHAEAPAGHLLRLA